MPRCFPLKYDPVFLRENALPDTKIPQTLAISVYVNTPTHYRERGIHR